MIEIDPASSVPPFEQARAQLADHILSGGLVAGTRLPTVRALAEQSGLAPNTVARAIKRLEAEGLVETRGRNGTVVAWSPDEALRGLEEAAAAYAERARALGVPAEQAGRVVDRALGRA